MTFIPNERIADGLKAAKALIADPKYWCQHSFGFLRNGSEIPHWNRAKYVGDGSTVANMCTTVAFDIASYGDHDLWADMAHVFVKGTNAPEGDVAPTNKDKPDAVCYLNNTMNHDELMQQFDKAIKDVTPV